MSILLLILLSVFFRVNPWLMLLLGLLLPSVANLLLILPSVPMLLPFTHNHAKQNLFELNLVLC